MRTTLGHPAVWEPLEELSVLDRVEFRPAAGVQVGAVTVGDAVCNSKCGRRHLLHTIRRERRHQALPWLEFPHDDLPHGALALPAADEPAVLGRREQLLDLAIPADDDPHQRLHSERVERGVDPPAVTTQDPMRAAGELTDRLDALPGEHAGLAGQAVPQPSPGVDRERGGLLLVEGAEALHSGAA